MRHTLSGRLAPLSLLLGGAVMGANFWLMRHLAAPALRTASGAGRQSLLGLVLAKFSVFIGLLALLFWRVPLEPLAFGVGATLLLVACVVAALRQPRALAHT